MSQDNFKKKSIVFEEIVEEMEKKQDILLKEFSDYLDKVKIKKITHQINAQL